MTTEQGKSLIWTLRVVSVNGILRHDVAASRLSRAREKILETPSSTQNRVTSSLLAFLHKFRKALRIIIMSVQHSFCAVHSGVQYSQLTLRGKQAKS